jgi:hypothetical protein
MFHRFPELFEFCNSLMLEDGPAIEDRNAFKTELGREGEWAEIHQHARDLGAVEGRTSGTGKSIGKLVAGSMVRRSLCALDLQGAAGTLGRPEDAEVAGKFRRCCALTPGTRVGGGTDESCATSLPNACLACPVTSGSTRTCRSARFRPRDARKQRERSRHELRRYLGSEFRETARKWIDANAPK